MNIDLAAERERELVNQIALVFERGGISPTAGRIVGRLLLCEPAHQSSTELADYLNASRGAISTETRMLIQAGLVERIRIPGDRSSYFRILDGCWTKILETEYLAMQKLLALGNEAMHHLSEVGATDARTKRVKDFRDFSAFFMKEIPLLLEHWESQRSNK